MPGSRHQSPCAFGHLSRVLFSILWHVQCGMMYTQGQNVTVKFVKCTKWLESHLEGAGDENKHFVFA